MYKLFYNRDINCITLPTNKHTTIKGVLVLPMGENECRFIVNRVDNKESERAPREYPTVKTEWQLKEQGSNKQHIAGAARVGSIILPLKWTWIVSDIEIPKPRNMHSEKFFFFIHTSHLFIHSFIHSFVENPGANASNTLQTFTWKSHSYSRIMPILFIQTLKFISNNRLARSLVIWRNNSNTVEAHSSSNTGPTHSK